MKLKTKFLAALNSWQFVAFGAPGAGYELNHLETTCCALYFQLFPCLAPSEKHRPTKDDSPEKMKNQEILSKITKITEIPSFYALYFFGDLCKYTIFPQ